jgi:hypothetical protein
VEAKLVVEEEEEVEVEELTLVVDLGTSSFALQRRLSNNSFSQLRFATIDRSIDRSLYYPWLC